MANYRLELHAGPATPAATQCLDVRSDEDARDLAEITLLLTPYYSRADVYRGEALIVALARDSHTG